MSSAEINREALREIYRAISLGCFIRKPVTIVFLIKRIMSELDYMYMPEVVSYHCYGSDYRKKCKSSKILLSTEKRKNGLIK